MDLSNETNLLHSDRVFSRPLGQSLFELTQSSIAREFEDTLTFEEACRGENSFLAYSRQGTLTTLALERRLSELEDGIGTLVFSSGMAAYDSVLTTILKSGSHLIASQKLFTNTLSMIENMRDRWNIEVDFFDPIDANQCERLVNSNTVAVLVESISNPSTTIPALFELGEVCRRNNLVYVVDNTVCGPLSFQPKKAQASLVIHSLSKSLAGHSRSLGGSVTDTGCYDWTNGIVSIDDKFLADGDKSYLSFLLRRGRSDKGNVLNCHDAAMISMGMETFSLRSAKVNSNARELAEFLETREEVEKVNYPGLESHPQYNFCKDHFLGAGGLLSFSLKRGNPSALLDNFRVIVRSSSIGDNRTLALPPATTIFAAQTADRHMLMGILPNMIRMSVGIENADDLKADLTQALWRMSLV